MNFKEVLIRLIAYTTPYVYDGNISLLELVRKLYKIVNELCIALQDMTADYEKFKEDVSAEIEGFTTDFTADLQALREYVDNYFESLDVEQTVRDVLQEMTDDGTLEELLNQTVLVNINNQLTSLSSTVSNMGLDITGLSDRTSALETDNTQNKSDISSLKTRTTTLETDNTQNKSDISSLNTRTSSLETDNTQNKSDISSLKTRTSSLETDNTQNKSDISAIEDYLNINNFTNYTHQDMTLSQQGTISNISQITLATNSTNTMGKIYGRIRLENLGSGYYTDVTIANTRLRPTQEIIVRYVGWTIESGGSIGESCTLILKTNGDIVLRIGKRNTETTVSIATYIPVVIFFKDFGDEE